MILTLNIDYFYSPRTKSEHISNVPDGHPLFTLHVYIC